jgi:hypothetical protein
MRGNSEKINRSGRASGWDIAYLVLHEYQNARIRVKQFKTNGCMNLRITFRNAVALDTSKEKSPFSLTIMKKQW